MGVKQVEDRIWLVSFMQFDLGFFDDETCRIESAENPFVAKLSPMSPLIVSGLRFKELGYARKRSMRGSAQNRSHNESRIFMQ